MATSAAIAEKSAAGRSTLATRVALALVLLAYLALGLYYNVANPIWEAPDEPAHYEYVLYLLDNHALPVRQSKVGDQLHQPPLYYLVGSLVVGWLADIDPLPIKGNPYFIWKEPRLGEEPNLAIHTFDELPPYKGTVLAVHLLRFVSLLFCLVGVWASYALARLVLPGRPWLAVAAAGFTAFVPQYLFVSSSLGNDGPAIAFGSLALYSLAKIALAVRARQPVARRCFALLGLWLGLGLISKLTFLGILPLAAVVGIYTLVAGRREWRRLVGGWAISGAVAALVGGWWYLRNLLIYANIYDLLGKGRTDWRTPVEIQEKPEQMAAIFSWFHEPLFQSYWLRFGWMNIQPEKWVYDSAIAFTAIAVAGCLLYLVQRRLRRGAMARDSGLGLILCLVAFLSVLGVTSFRFAYTIGNHYPQGRYLYPAQPAIAVLLILGLATLGGLLTDGLRHRPSGRRLARATSIGAALALPLLLATSSVLAVDRYITPRYEYWPLWQRFDASRLPHKIEANYGGLLSLIGYELHQQEVAAGGQATIDLFWRAETTIGQDLQAFVHVADATAQPLAQKDGPTGGAKYPTSKWQKGEVILEQRVIPIADSVPAGSYQVLVGVYSLDTMQRLPLQGSAGATAANLGTIEVLASSLAAQNR